MRKRIGYGLVVSALSVAAFFSTPSAAEAGQGCTEQLARDFTAGWSHDLPKLMSQYSDNAVYEDAASHVAVHGKEGLRGLAEGWFKAFPDLNLAFASAIVSGNRAAVTWQATGTQRGDMPGMPASNKTMNVAGVSLMECADGKITYAIDYYDMATVMRQLGFLSTSPTN